jgi:hypothetical protein
MPLGAIQGYLHANHPRPADVPHNIAVVGDGQQDGPSAQPPTVSYSVKDTNLYQISAIAYSPTLSRIVFATKRAGKTFLHSDDLASTSTVDLPPDGYSGTVERIVWCVPFELFIAISTPGSSHPILTSPDGLAWTAHAVTLVSNVNSGLAFSNDAIMISFGEQVVYSEDGVNWIAKSTGIADGLSLLWHAATGQFYGFRDGTDEYYVSTHGDSWDGPHEGPDIIQGAYCANEANSGRLVVFGSSIAASYSDDDGTTWHDATGFALNSGNTNRYVAITADTIYVAFDAEVNIGFLTTDNGATWSAAYHKSGIASGATVIA